MAIVLGENLYGKAEVRLVHIDRSSAVHKIKDVNVTSQLIGEFSETYLTGSNQKIIATDTQKNTVFALARQGGVGSIEDFALRLGRHFVGYEQVSGARQEVEEYSWDRISTDGVAHDHSFVRSTAEVRNTVVRTDGETETVVSGLSNIVVLNSTDSEFWGFPDIEYTSLVETNDRILATAVSARWRYVGTDIDWDQAFATVRATMLTAFATTYSYSLQQSLFAMGKAVLEVVPQIAEIRMSMPNKHHFLVDLGTWDLDNPNEVWYAADRPYGLIEAAVGRDDVAADPAAWNGIAGFI